MRNTVAAIALEVLTAVADAAPRYAAVPIGTPGAISVEGSAINALGQVTGTVQLADGQWRAFLNTEGAMTMIDVAGASTSWGNAINAVGDVAGCASIAGSTRGFLVRGGVVELLPDKNGSNTVGCAVGISGDGHVVGQQSHDFQYSVAPSYRYFDGSFEDIPQTVAGINNRGDTAGTAYYHVGAPRAWATNTALSELLPYGRESYATAINDQRQVTGVFHPDPTNRGPFHAFLYSDEVLNDLGALGDQTFDVRLGLLGSNSGGSGLNNRGEVVGSSEGRAFLYTGGAIHDLNALVDAGLDDATLTTASGINDAGVIVANSCRIEPSYPAPCKAFRLDPLPDANNPANVPALSHLALALLAFLVVACGVGVRRR